MSGCDWKFAETIPHGNSLDLTHFGAQDGSWRLRAGDSAAWNQPCAGDTCHLEMAVYGGHAATLRRKVRWDAESHRVLTWTWSLGARVDSLAFTRKAAPAAAMAVDVTLASAFGFHKTVRYVWSARADRGAVWSHRDNWHPKVRVLRDARDSVGVLVTERVDVWKDFEQLWGFTPRHQALAIVVSVLDPAPPKRLVGRFGPILALPQENP